MLVGCQFDRAAIVPILDALFHHQKISSNTRVYHSLLTVDHYLQTLFICVTAYQIIHADYALQTKQRQRRMNNVTCRVLF